jgi:hypothetical protein
VTAIYIIVMKAVLLTMMKNYMGLSDITEQ